MPKGDKKNSKETESQLHRILAAVGLDASFQAGEGDSLYYKEESGEVVYVSDFASENSAQGNSSDSDQYIKNELYSLFQDNQDVLAGIIAGNEGFGLKFNLAYPYKSNTLFFLAKEGVLVFAISACLLHTNGIRIYPAQDNPHVLRIVPSNTIKDAEINNLLAALREICLMLRNNQVSRLLAHILKVKNPPLLNAIAFDVLRDSPEVSGLRKVAFIGHFISPRDLVLWDPYLGGLAAENYAAMLDKMKNTWGPRIYNRIRIKGKVKDICLMFIGLPVHSGQMLECLHSRQLASIRHMISDAVDLAVSEGCEVVGLGGYTSILSRNGKTLSDKPIAVTTGNSYTVASAILALTREARTRKIDLTNCTAAIVGAGGNIGSVMAQMLATEVSRLILIGRENRLEKLDVLKDKITQYLATAGKKSVEILVTDDPYALEKAELIATASNSATPIIYPDMLRNSQVLICDVSVPGDIDSSVLEKYPNLKIIKGGVIYSPLNPDFFVPGIPLSNGNLFACMTETILMGMEDISKHYSYGDIHLNQVNEIAQIASKHGFDDIVSKTANSY